MPEDQRPIRKLSLGDHPLSGPLNLALIHNRRRRQRFDGNGKGGAGSTSQAGAAKLKADRTARLEAELVIDRWNRRLATGRDMLWSPTSVPP
jgi:hypothetical protein